MSQQSEIIRSCIQNAAESIAKAWPLYAFVTSNPLAGLEDQSFDHALHQARKLFGARGLPSAHMFRQAWRQGWIETDCLTQLFQEAGMQEKPCEHLQKLEKQEAAQTARVNPTAELDRLMIKWLTAFMDEGMAEWWMPGRRQGFYRAWQDLAPFDRKIPDAKQLNKLPKEPLEAIDLVISNYPREDWPAIFCQHLAALPGWTGLIKYRIDEQTKWQQHYPVTLEDYLAVRLSLAVHLGYDLYQGMNQQDDKTGEDQKLIWLKAWEQTYHQHLVRRITETGDTGSRNDQQNRLPNAQLVFCIDTRSEVIRRHIEQSGNYETLGYAGFFGIPMDYQTYHSPLVRKSCPPILPSSYKMTDQCNTNQQELAEHYDFWQVVIDAAKKLLNTFKNNVPASFGYVEGAGGFYGLSLTARTLLPKAVHHLGKRWGAFVSNPDRFCHPAMQKQDQNSGKLAAMPVEEKIACAKAAFTLTGWQQFARLVIFVGHAGQSANNPFDSSLDCGACAGSPGRYNARALASMCNETEVRQGLAEEGEHIPDETIFVAGEHNTTTDEIVLFDAHVPETHRQDLAQLKQHLAQARQGAAEERIRVMNTKQDQGVREVERRASDWAETRPEWGLATNAAFVIGPRQLTQQLNLGGRCFLHSYDWQTDPQGAALEAIMNGPVVVTQWINNHYYFATVDNELFGSGNKVTQNVVGRFGVVQGNGGDLMTGLPLQSLQADDNLIYHQPLRLMVLIHAPVRIVSDILKRHNSVARLFKNEWLYLKVIDPEQDHQVIPYKQGFEATVAT